MDYQGVCGTCKHYRGSSVGQCKHHMAFMMRFEECKEGELDPSILLQFRYGATEVVL